jgi:hypothetical protein
LLSSLQAHAGDLAVFTFSGADEPDALSREALSLSSPESSNRCCR